ncbi:MAG: hypothetical protein GYA21_11310 [Myxococcales bacterium]|nr:hypothetical protein [Myxococcales bacterium]
MTEQTPQEKRRLTLPREQVFTAAMAGSDIQRAFLLKSRLVFAIGIAIGLLAMWLGAALVEERLMHLLRWPLLGVGLLLWASGPALGRGRMWADAALFFAAWALIGGGVGCMVGESVERDLLLNPTLLLGVLLLGLLVNTRLRKRPAAPAVEFLGLLPWLIAAVAATWFFPAGEWPLALSGAAGLLLAATLAASGERALGAFTPGESVRAGTAALSLCLQSGWERLRGSV